MRVTRRISWRPWNRAIPLVACVVLCLSFTLLAFGARTLSTPAPRTAGHASRAKPVFSPAEPLPDISPAYPALIPTGITGDDLRTYQGKSCRFVKTLTLRVTAYAPDRRCTFPFPGTTTSSGLPVTTNGGHLVAADTGVIPLHWLVEVPGYCGGAPVPVLDRGSAIKGNRLDVLLPTFDQAQSWGVRTLSVRLYQPEK